MCLDEVVVDIIGGVYEVVSLGDVFGIVVNLFSEFNGKLLDNFKCIEMFLE